VCYLNLSSNFSCSFATTWQVQMAPYLSEVPSHSTTITLGSGFGFPRSQERSSKSRIKFSSLMPHILVWRLHCPAIAPAIVPLIRYWRAKMKMRKEGSI
jgi:hypothetical protein